MFTEQPTLGPWTDVRWPQRQAGASGQMRTACVSLSAAHRKVARWGKRPSEVKHNDSKQRNQTKSMDDNCESEGESEGECRVIAHLSTSVVQDLYPTRGISSWKHAVPEGLGGPHFNTP